MIKVENYRGRIATIESAFELYDEVIKGSFIIAGDIINTFRLRIWAYGLDINLVLTNGEITYLYALQTLIDDITIREAYELINTHTNKEIKLLALLRR